MIPVSKCSSMEVLRPVAEELERRISKIRSLASESNTVQINDIWTISDGKDWTPGKFPPPSQTVIVEVDGKISRACLWAGVWVNSETKEPLGEINKWASI